MDPFDIEYLKTFPQVPVFPVRRLEQDRNLLDLQFETISTVREVLNQHSQEIPCKSSARTAVCDRQAQDELHPLDIVERHRSQCYPRNLTQSIRESSDSEINIRKSKLKITNVKKQKSGSDTSRSRSTKRSQAVRNQQKCTTDVSKNIVHSRVSSRILSSKIETRSDNTVKCRTEKKQHTCTKNQRITDDSSSSGSRSSSTSSSSSSRTSSSSESSSRTEHSRQNSKRKLRSRRKKQHNTRSRSSSRSSSSSSSDSGSLSSTSSSSSSTSRCTSRSRTRSRTSRQSTSARHGNQWKIPKCFIYDGKSNWQSFELKFKSYRDALGWSDMEAKYYLMWSLEGNALDYFTMTSVNDRHITFKTMMKKLRTRFGVTDLTETSMDKFRQATKNSDETLEDWADRVMTLAIPAFVNLPAKLRKKESITKFCQGCDDQEAAKHACLKQPRTMEAAIDLVRHYQYVSQAVKGENPPNTCEEVSVNVLTEDRVQEIIALAIERLVHQLKQSNCRKQDKPCDTSKVKCFFCQKLGHMEADCWIRKNVMERRERA